MQISKRAAVVTLAVAALGGSAATAVTAAGHDNGRRHNDGDHRGEALVRTTLAPSVPAPADPVIDGASPGGVPWVLQRGEARLRSDGDLRVELRGLLIPSGQFAGTTGPVHTVSASLYCGGNVQGTTAQFPLSPQGDAELEGMVTVPATCLVPTVLVHPNGGAGAYIAASGFGG
jgi:hypothetical protein